MRPSVGGAAEAGAVGGAGARTSTGVAGWQGRRGGARFGRRPFAEPGGDDDRGDHRAFRTGFGRSDLAHAQHLAVAPAQHDVHSVVVDADVGRPRLRQCWDGAEPIELLLDGVPFGAARRGGGDGAGRGGSDGKNRGR